MSFFNQPFDTSKVEASNGFDPLPEGEYACLITKAEEKPCKNDGIQLVVEFKVIDGKLKNRTLFHRINLKNANERAAQIGAGQLSALAHELSNKTVRVKVKVEADSRTAGAFQNKVTSIASMTGQAAQAAAVASAPVPADAPPWG
jgi:hypothetical protein